MGPVKVTVEGGITFTFTFEIVHSKKFKEDDYIQVGGIFGLGGKIEGTVGGEGKLGPATGSLGATGTASAQVDIGLGTRYASNFNQVGKYNSTDANLGFSGSAGGSASAFGSYMVTAKLLVSAGACCQDNCGDWFSPVNSSPSA